jgi:TonB-dependent starch-binding outer membrane protein SusC
MKEAKHSKTRQFNRLMLLIIVVLFAFGSANAQSKTVTGVVKDQSGETIIGASVQVKGTKVATITGLDGSYKINVPAEAKSLVISYVGMDKKEVVVSGNVINVMLENSDKTLDEVVVVGYGTQKKRDLTGSVSSVGEKALKDIPVSSVAEALTGKLTGVQVTTTEGSPDAEIKIRVRGGGSITQSNSPLYIVDGFAKDDIKDIAPSEIEDISVLKDASSTAIYGSRGANGVVLITTKTAKQGKLSVSYNGYMGMKEVSKTLDVLTPFQFARKQYERAVWGGGTKVASEYETYFGNYGDIDLYNYVKGTNWQNETFGNSGITQNHSLSLSGGDKKFSYTANYSHVYDKAIMYMSNYSRDNISVKLKYEPLKWLKFDVATRYASTTVNGSGANDQTGLEKSTSDSRVKSAVVYTPIPLKNLVSQDDDTEATASLYSPIQSTEDNNRYQNTHELSFNGGVTLSFNKNLSLNSTFGYTKSDKTDKRFFGLSSYYVREGGAYKRDNATAPAIFLTDQNKSTFQNTNVFNFKKKNLFEGHNLNAILGEEMLIRTNNYYTQDIEAFTRTDMSADAWGNIADGTVRPTRPFTYPDYRLLSYFGRLNYDINDKYLIALILRTDASSKFAAGNQWGFFPSGSVGWRISDEQFMEGAKTWLSNLKLRGGFGASGNDNIDDGAFIRSYTSSPSNYLEPDVFSSIYSAGQTLANPDLKWETTVTKNVGLDFGFFNSRLSGSIELYQNDTHDALMLVNISGVGYTNQWQNVASTQNKGVELSLNADLVKTKDFDLAFSFNISANQNKVMELGKSTIPPFNESWTSYSEASNSYTVSVGQPVGLIYGFQSDGMYAADDFNWNGTSWVMNAAKYTTYNAATKVYTDASGKAFVDNSSIDGLSWGPGAMKLKDTNGDGKITIDDKVLIGNTNPKHFGSFGFTSRFKGFDASVNFNWVYGNQIYNATKIELTAAYYKYRNTLTSTLNSYTQIDWATGSRVTDAATLTSMNENADMWAAPTGRYATTSWAIEDGSFLRLNNVTVGYTLPKKFTTKFYIQKLRVYASGYNLATFTKYTGYDPEVDSRRSTPATPGVDYSAYPKSRSYNVGVNITF